MEDKLNYASNSHKFKAEQKKQEEKKIEKVVTGTVKTKKKSEIRKLTDVFVSSDTDSVKNYILMDVLVPAVKKAISDIVTNGIDMLLYGESGVKKKSSGSKVSYRSYYDKPSERASTIASRSKFDFDDIIVESRGEAEQIFDQMQEIIDTYTFVSVSDLYDMVDLTAPYTANKYGWTNIRSADAIRLSGGGYLLKLPKAKALD